MREELACASAPIAARFWPVGVAVGVAVGVVVGVEEGAFIAPIPHCRARTSDIALSLQSLFNDILGCTQDVGTCHRLLWE